MYDYLPFLMTVELREKEIVKEYKLFNGDNKRYFVSNYGDRIYSLCGDQVIELSINIDTKGYYYTTFQNNTLLNPRDKRRIHQIVAEVYCHNPYNEDICVEVHHKDFNKQNNRYDNLEYLSVPEHIKKHCEHRRLIKQQNTQSKNE